MICEFEAVYRSLCTSPKRKIKKKYMYKGKKKTTQQFKTFGTLTVFQLWSIRGISICLLVLWHGQINTMEFLKCCKRSHFTKAKFTELSFRIGICVRQRYGTEAIGRVQFLSWKYTIRRLIIYFKTLVIVVFLFVKIHSVALSLNFSTYNIRCPGFSFYYHDYI